MIVSYRNRKPIVKGRIAQNCTIIGNVKIEEDASIWYGAVLRGDTCSITIEENANVQDNVVIHTDPGYPVVVSKNVSVGHGAILHGCFIDENTVIGMNAVLLNGCHIGKSCIIGANALVSEGMIIEDNSIAVGIPCKVIKKISEQQSIQNLENAKEYVQLSKELLEEL